MLKETSVVALAGAKRLVIAAWALFCLLLALIFFVVGVLKLLGLAGAMAMLTMDGMVASENASTNATVHIIFMLIFFGLAWLSWHWFNLARKSLSTPFESDIKKAAILVNEIEVGAKAGAKSVRDATRSAIEEAKQPGSKDT